MRKIFNSDFKVTQLFKNNPAYYAQFGLAGHEGLDVVPTTSDWAIHALEDGVVVRDEDNPRSGAYGIYVTIWSPTLNKATQYCHLSSNIVSFNQQVKKGEKIGTMGSTGNTNGAHVHLNLFETNTDGIRLNKDNGYNGGIDPLPFLNEGGVNMANMYKGYDLNNPESMKVAVDVLVRVQNGEFVEKAKYEADINKAKEEVKKQYESQVKDLQTKLATCEARPTGNPEAEKTLAELKAVLNKIV
jgi:hypothetical protein